MPGPSLTPFASDMMLPGAVDVVVIGGGIIGTTTALELAERGLSVLLCEKGQIGGEQSSRNWGWVRMALRDPREIPLMAEALRAWDGMDERTGRATGFTRSGILFGARTDKERAEYARWITHLAPHQIEARLIEGAELDGWLPGYAGPPFKGALLTPQDGRAEPQWAAPAIAEAARDRGATVMTNCAVRSLETEAGRVTGVMTERGRVRCDAVVLAGGAWSRLFCGNAGIDLPQLKVMNTVMRTTPVEGPTAAMWTKGLGIRKRADGGYTVADGGADTVDLVPDSFRLARQFFPALIAEWSSLRFRLSGRWSEEARLARHWTPDEVTPFEECRILDPEPQERYLRSAWAAARRAFPVLEGADIVQSWAGLIDVTPDAVPVISPVDALPGLVIATGFSGHGFGIGPGASKLAADLVTGGAPCVDPAAFRLSRFSDGSRVYLDKGY